MGKRDFLFLGVCLVGVLFFVGPLFRRSAVPEPKHVNAARYSGLAETAASPADAKAKLAAETDEFRRTIRQVNLEFAESWQNEKLTPAPRADELLIARRLSLGLTGTVPSLEEIRRFEAQPENERLDWWVTHLLEDRRYATYVAERFARAYVGTELTPFIVFRRDIFVSWLADCLHKNMPYDEMVRRLLTDQGLWTDTPAVNFMSGNGDSAKDNQPDPIKLAGRSSRAFLGIRLDCVECHDDNLGGPWLQTNFHELGAFFGHTRLQFNGVRETPKLDFTRDREYRYKYLKHDKEEVIPPRVPYAPELLPERGSRRERLAVWITHTENKAFARTAVNRTWAQLFGKPLVEPIDNIPLEGPFPPGMETLADDFTKHGYDLQRLVRLLAGTQAFAVASHADFEITPTHERNWATFPLTRLRPEEVSGSLLQAASLSTIGETSHVVTRLSFLGQRNEFVKRYGDKGQDEFSDRGGTIPQRLLLLNGDLVKERTQENFLLNAATRIALLAPNDNEAVEATYLTLLSRRPTEAEREYFANRLASSQSTERIGRLEDLYWVLLNSTEFSWNH